MIQILFGVGILVMVLLHVLMKPSVDIDDENDQFIIHYWWFWERKTYVI